jgi:hypothetical protein
MPLSGEGGIVDAAVRLLLRWWRQEGSVMERLFALGQIEARQLSAVTQVMKITFSRKSQ